ncbi:phosphate ABC transporter permease PstA [uncultured Bacteroides sp.]|jgi:phosphate transport system permease protein|uniref:phosphate ABC transporter permease PstA n=1 Tax=uncultured Bacteroides sp. TaxID=162156 RepID=UPI0025EA4550|nr:phosphate ABC transporter permease PstA [uncultured Bacteroides sp.]
MNEIKTVQRLYADRVFKGLVCIFAGLTAIPLLAILGEVLMRGCGQLSWSFFTEPTPTAFRAMQAVAAGEPIPGGIANGIIGSVLMLGMATVVAVPIGIMCGVYLAENAKKRFAVVVSYITDLLQGTPSVIIGIITYVWVVVPMKGYSAIAGSVALFIMMLPLIIRSTEETVKILPASLKEAGLALGGNRARVTLKVILPSAFGGIFTGILLAVSRVIGETAPLMFTALGCSFIRWDIDKPISAVPLLIWEFFNDPNLQELIWGASLFLLIFVLSLNLTAKYFARKWNS